MNPITPDDLKQFKLTRLVALAMLVVAPMIYLIMATNINSVGEKSIDVTVMKYMLLLIAVTEPALWFVIRRLVVRMRELKAESVPRAKLYFMVMINKLALVAAIYVYGLVLFFLTGEIMEMTWFYLIGAIWTVLFWPKREQFERAMNEGLEVL